VGQKIGFRYGLDGLVNQQLDRQADLPFGQGLRGGKLPREFFEHERIVRARAVVLQDGVCGVA
jgi:hypothetical protein